MEMPEGLKKKRDELVHQKSGCVCSCQTSDEKPVDQILLKYGANWMFKQLTPALEALEKAGKTASHHMPYDPETPGILHALKRLVEIKDTASKALKDLGIK